MATGMGLIISRNSTPIKDRSLWPMRSIVAAATLLLTSGAHAAEWTFVPAVQGSETYSDNVKLTNDNLKQGDFITSVTPTFSATARGPNLTVNSTFALQDVNYANQ